MLPFVDHVLRNIFIYLDDWKDRYHLSIASGELWIFFTTLSLTETIYFDSTVQLENGSPPEELPRFALDNITELNVIFNQEAITNEHDLQFASLLERIPNLRRVTTTQSTSKTKQAFILRGIRFHQSKLSHRPISVQFLPEKKACTVQPRATILPDQCAPVRPSTPPRQIVNTDHMLESNSPKSRARLQDLFVTPPSVNKKLEEYKERLLQEHMLMARLIPRKRKRSNVKQYLPLSLIKSVGSHAYTDPDLNINKQLSAITEEVQFDRVNELVESLASNLIECVFLSEDHWVLVTQFETYVQFHHLDDCSRNERPFQHVTEPVIHLHKKQEGTRTWNELLLKWQNVEILCTGGVVASYGGEHMQIEAFCGPTLRLKQLHISEHEEFLLYVREEQAEYVKDRRSLRDVTKRTASYPWSFCSSRFSQNHFKTVTSSNLHRHPAKGTKVDLAWVASFLVDKYLDGNITKDDIQKAEDALVTAKAQKLTSNVRSSYLPLVERTLKQLETNNDIRLLGAETISGLTKGTLRYQVQTIQQSLISKNVYKSVLL